MLHSTKNFPTGITRQRGLSAIEFTLALPFMLLMFAIFVEFGRVYIQYTTLSKAVQDGARYAISSNATNLQIQNVVVYGRQDGGDTPILPALSIGMVYIEPYTNTDPDTGIKSNYVAVKTIYPYTPLLLNLKQFDDGHIFDDVQALKRLLDISLSASAVVRDSL